MDGNDAQKREKKTKKTKITKKSRSRLDEDEPLNTEEAEEEELQ
jgi:hypothetical protein